jgi:hypothetical protein
LICRQVGSQARSKTNEESAPQEFIGEMNIVLFSLNVKWKIVAKRLTFTAEQLSYKLNNGMNSCKRKLKDE